MRTRSLLPCSLIWPRRPTASAPGITGHRYDLDQYVYEGLRAGANGFLR